MAPRPADRHQNGAGWERFRTHNLPLMVLILITIVAYANAWPDTLVWDDGRFAVSERYLGLGLDGVLRFFTEDVWAIEGENAGLYRPLLLLSLMLDAHLFGDWAAGYHLINILLHVLATLLVYGLVRYLLHVNAGPAPLSGYIALLAAIVFGVHPIHTEVVNSIFNRSEILVSLGVVGGLWWFLSTRASQPKMAWFGLSLIYMLVLLCRESGAALPALAVAMLWFTLPGNWLLKLRKCIPVVLLLIPLGIYLILRANALDSPGVSNETGMLVTEKTAAPFTLAEVAPSVIAGAAAPAAEHISERSALVAEAPAPAAEIVAAPTQQLPGPTQAAQDAPPVAEDAQGPVIEQPGPIAVLSRPAADQFSKVSRAFADLKDYDAGRLLYAARLWADSLKIMLWPNPLMLYHGKPDTPLWLALVLQLTLLVAALAGCAHGRPGLITGLAFFYIALLPSSGIIGAVDYPSMAERYLYLPSVGMAILLAYGLSWLARRCNLPTAIVSIVFIAVLLLPLTWMRNAQWADNKLLAEADYRRGVQNNLVLRALVMQYVKAKNYSRAVAICDRHAAVLRQYWDLSNYCGSAYVHAGLYDKAEQTLLPATGYPLGAAMVNFTLASMYLRLGRRNEAQKRFQMGIAAEDKPFLREFLAGFMLTQLYPSDPTRMLEARTHFERALELQPQFFQARRLLDQLNETAGPR